MKWLKSKFFPVLKILGIVLLLICILEAWEHHVTVSIHKAIPPEAVKSEQDLWIALCALIQDSQSYYEQCDEIYKEGDKKRPKTDLKSNDAEDYGYDETHIPRIVAPPRRFAVDKLRRSAAKYAGRLRERRRQMEKTADDPDIGYRQDALLYWVLCERSFDLQLLAWEFMLNAEAEFARHPLAVDRSSKRLNSRMSYYMDPAFVGYYKLYYNSPRVKGFKYPYFVFLMLERDALRCALYRAEYRCNQGHGGYGYWQGEFAETIWGDFSWNNYLGLFFNDNSSELYSVTGSRFNSYHDREYRADSHSMVKSAWFRALELRDQSPSVYSAIFIPLIKTAENCRRLISIYRENWWNKPNSSSLSGYMTLLWIPRSCRTPEDKLWDTARFLYLCTDNFLWKIKFAESSHVEDNKLYPCSIRAKYGKNSAELRFYRNALAADLKSCRRKIKDAGGTDSSELQEAALKVCAETEAILKIWDSYIAGKITYADYVKTLRKQEKSYYHRRCQVMKARWNHLLKKNKQALKYTKQELSLDGIPYFLIDQWVDEELEKKEDK